MSSRYEKDRLDAWLTRAPDDDADATGECRHCGAPIWHDGHGSWVDSSDGDGCGDNDESAVHEPYDIAHTNQKENGQ